MTRLKAPEYQLRAIVMPPDSPNGVLFGMLLRFLDDQALKRKLRSCRFPFLLELSPHKQRRREGVASLLELLLDPRRVAESSVIFDDHLLDVDLVDLLLAEEYMHSLLCCGGLFGAVVIFNDRCREFGTLTDRSIGGQGVQAFYRLDDGRCPLELDRNAEMFCRHYRSILYFKKGRNT